MRKGTLVGRDGYVRSKPPTEMHNVDLTSEDWQSVDPAGTYLFVNTGGDLIIKLIGDSEFHTLTVGDNAGIRLSVKTISKDSTCTGIVAFGPDGNQSVAGIPSVATALFWLDGTLSGSEFVDKSGNGRNFTITNKDFTANYFPYKSAATISAPVGDATLIAADVNNFLYDSGGDPNAIPVVSFFQNIDYENKLFCKHTAQVVDGNDVETSEPYITDIVLYSAALTGDDLTTANTYYGVPVVDATALYVAADGNDTTGDGSKLTPWATMQKAIDTVNDGKTIYIQSKEDTGHPTAFYMNCTNANFLQGLGLVKIDTADTTYGIRVRDGDADGFNGLYVVPSANVNYLFWTLLGETIPVNRNYIDANTSTYVVTGDFIEFINNIVNATSATALLNITGGTENRIISTNLFKGTTQNGIRCIDDTGNVSVLNNLFSGSHSSYIINAISTSGIYTINGNDFTPATLTTGIDITVPIASIDYNAFTLPTSGSVSAVILRTIKAQLSTVNNNTFDISDGYGGSCIVAVNSQMDCNNNIIDGGTTEITATADIKTDNTEAGAIAAVKFKNNKCLTNRSADYHLQVGEEATAGGDNVITATEIENNYIKGREIFTPGGAQTTHGIFVGFQIDASIRYNSINGDSLGVVLKGSSGTIYTANGVSYNIITESTQGVLIKGSQSINVVNNTIVNKTVDFVGGILLNDNTGSDDADNCVVKNNIIIAMGTGNQNMIVMDAGASNVIDYNLYYCPNGTPLWDGGDWATWQTAGYDANGKVLTDEEFAALFTDYDNDDFSLPSGSVAIGAGETLAAAYDDGLDASTAWGDDSTVPSVVTKQQTAPWDIGAYIS